MRSIAGLEPLVAAAATGDADAFARVIGATGGLVTSIALAIVRDVDMSQDIAQDVLLLHRGGLNRVSADGCLQVFAGLRSVTT